MCLIIQPTKSIAAGKAEFRAIHIIDLCVEMLKSSVTGTLKKNCNAGGVFCVNCTFIKMGSELNLGLTESAQNI